MNAHMLQSMITAESKTLLEDAVDFDQAELCKKSLWLLRNRRRQRSARRAVPRQLHQKHETGQSAHLLQVSKPAFSWRRREVRRRNTRLMEPRGLRRHGTVLCVKSPARSSSWRRLHFTYRSVDTFRSSPLAGRLGKSSTQ